MLNFTILGQCRGDGKGYIKIRIDNGPSRLLSAYAQTDKGTVLPCGMYDMADSWNDRVLVSHLMEEKTKERMAVVVVPLLDGCSMTVKVVAGTAVNDETLFSFRYRPLESKIRSRLAYKLNNLEITRIRDIDQRMRAGLPDVSVTGIFPAGSGRAVCRVHASLPWDSSDEPVTVVCDESGNLLSTTPIQLESSYIPSARDSNIHTREVDYSLCVDDVPKTLYFGVYRRGHSPADGNFVCLLPDRFLTLLNGSRGYFAQVSADPSYSQWFDRRRAKPAELIAQRSTWRRFSHAPLISIVVVVFRTPEQYLRELLESVLCQSYERFELIIVNVSGDCPEIDKFLGTVDDKRVHIIAAENRTIPENTNIGIEKTQGDYIAFVDHDDVLEPDILYRYADVINHHPETDLLYCDEDFLRNGRLENPIFKPGFNPDLLYAHNYITHMLMVSRHALDRVELSGADTNGAQDYDLTLKCVEVAREIHNVPRVLYHWRMHEQSTSSNPDSKPYAREAGRLALQRHFDRMDVPTVVEDADRPFFYTPRYEFTSKISVVIPTKDHVELLSRCLDSVFEKTTYKNYDITLVENNSTERQTFEYYDSITKAYDNVQVVTWPGKGFNYSAICNYGAEHSDGEIILFLNNDTEVIAPGWMGSMVGFFARPEVGVVGAKLLYSDGLIQHGGIVVEKDGPGVMHMYMPADDDGYMGLLRYPADCQAVTGACQMVRRSVFESIGGMDEQLAVAFNDVDLCLAVAKAGYLTVFDPDSILRHNEHSSRGNDERDERQRIRFQIEKHRFGLKWPSAVDNGDYINPNLDRYYGSLPD